MKSIPIAKHIIFSYIMSIIIIPAAPDSIINFFRNILLRLLQFVPQDTGLLQNGQDSLAAKMNRSFTRYPLREVRTAGF
jgi:hypothetical protein